VIAQETGEEERVVIDQQETTEEITREEIAQTQPVVVDEQIVADEVVTQEDGEFTENTSEPASDMPATEEQSIAASPVPESIPQSDAAQESVVESDAADAAIVEKLEQQAEAEAEKRAFYEDASSVVSSSAVPEGIEWPASSEVNTSADGSMMKENIQATY